jgi:hypothetical protein
MAKLKWAGTAIAGFDLVQRAIRVDSQADEITELFRLTGKACLAYLQNIERKPLTSLVPNKAYFSFINASGKSSRAVNLALFQGEELINKFSDAVLSKNLTNLTSAEITNACYTVAVSLACVVDLTNVGDRQTPGTYFQYLVTHLLTRTLESKPSARVKVKIGEDEVPLTMDLLLNLGPDKPKYHIAIKNSTRERGSEFWAHQRILDKAHEAEKYIGIFIGLAETKLNHRTFNVVEICVPDQWRAYQQYIAKISGVYYLDPPYVYLKLKDKTPNIVVKHFGEFFFDAWGQESF